ncbi:glycosyltransferase [Spirillospora sp. CA-255316]
MPRGRGQGPRPGPAARARGQWLVFVDPDAVPAPGSIEALLDCARAEPQAGIVGGRCIAPDGTTDPRSWWGRPGLWSAFCFATLLSSLFPGFFTGKATVMRRHVGKGAVRLLLTGVFLRAALSRVVSARPHRQGSPTARGEDWRELWKRRHDWSKGWPTP